MPFDRNTERSSYYTTDAIPTSNGLLACDATFPPSGAGPCFVQVRHSHDDGQTWCVISQLTKPSENYDDEVGLLETEPGVILCLLRDREKAHPDGPVATWRRWSRDGGNSWTQRENIANMVGRLQRPFLTRLDDMMIVLSGRYGSEQTVAYLSRDNGSTFGNRFVLDKYLSEGAYTAAVPSGPRSAVIAWHSDQGEREGQPRHQDSDIEDRRPLTTVATVTLSGRGGSVCYVAGNYNRNFGVGIAMPIFNECCFGGIGMF